MTKSESDRYADGTERLKQEQGVTTEYGVLVTLERNSKHILASRTVQYWSPAPTSEDEAIELTKQEYDGEIEEIRSVETREVPAPAKWPDDDPRIRSVQAGTEHAER